MWKSRCRRAAPPPDWVEQIAAVVLSDSPVATATTSLTSAAWCDSIRVHEEAQLRLRGILIAAVLVSVIVASVFYLRSRRNSPPADSPITTPPNGVQHSSEDSKTSVTLDFGGSVVMDGQPANESIVQVAKQEGVTVGRVVEIKTGVDGLFAATMAPGVYLLQARKGRRVSQLVRIDLSSSGPEDRQRIKLEIAPCDGVLWGKVHDAKGPVGGARVASVGEVDWGNAVQSSAEGDFELCVRPGERRFRVEAFGYGTVAFRRFIGKRTRQDLFLAPESVIEGTVVRDQGALGSAALVTLRTRETATEHAVATSVETDADGRFRAEGLASGRWIVTAAAKDGVTSHPVEVVTTAGETRSGLVLRLTDCYGLDGRVVLDGKPVSDASVRVIDRETLETQADVRTNELGAFAVGCVLSGESLFRVRGYEVVTPMSLSVKAKNTSAEIVVRRAAGIHGRVVANGAPVAYPDVTYTGGNKAQARVQGDESGVFRIENIVPAPYALMAREGARTGQQVITVTAGNVSEVTIEVDAGGVVKGRVVDSTGGGVDNVMVTLAGPTATQGGFSVTDQTGEFEIVGIQGNGVFAATVLEGANARQVLLPVGGSHPLIELTDTQREKTVLLRVDLARGGIEGRVVDLQGQPISDVSISALRTVSNEVPRIVAWNPGTRSISDESGKFRFEGLVKGKYALYGLTSKGQEGYVTGVDVGTKDVQLVLGSQGSIRGKLEAFASAPTVFVQSLSSQSDRTWRVFPDGSTFLLEDVPSGRYAINAQSTTEGTVATVDVKAGQTTDVTLRSKGGGKLVVTVYGSLAEKSPLPSEKCNVIPRSGDWLGYSNFAGAKMTDENGTVVFESAPAGEVAISCVGNAATHSTALGATDLTARGTAQVELRAVPLGSPLVDIGGQMDLRRIRPVFATVVPLGSAATAGVQPGDEVLAVDEVRAAQFSPHGVQVLISQRLYTGKVTLSLLRNGKETEAVLRRP